MFNRICHTVSHTGERCVRMSRRHRLPAPVESAIAPHDRIARHRLVLAEAL